MNNGGFARVRILAATLLAAFAVSGCSVSATAGDRLTGPDEFNLPGPADGLWRASDDYELPFRRWGPSRPQAVVLAIHGLTDYSGGMREIGEYLAEADIATYAYDQRGFGKTSGRGDWHGIDRYLRDAAERSRALAEAYPDTPLFIAGHSMGGAVTLTFVAETDPEWVDGVVLIAPAVWGRSAMPWYQRSALWVGERLLKEVEFTGQITGVRPTDNLRILQERAHDPMNTPEVSVEVMGGVSDLMDRALRAPPELSHRMLYLYGLRDEVVPPEPTCIALGRFADRTDLRHRYVIYPQGYHMLTRDLQARRVLEDMAAWITEPERRKLPSHLERSRKDATRRVCAEA